VSVGVNVAVITELPAPTTVAELPLTEMTEVVAEEYVNVPGVLDVGSVSGNVASPYAFVTAPHDPKVGVAFPIAAVFTLVAEGFPFRFVAVILTESWAPTSDAPAV
jgi:hypothetical protein